LEDEGHGAEVRFVQLLEHLDGLVVVLGRGSTHEGEACQVHYCVDHHNAW